MGIIHSCKQLNFVPKKFLPVKGLNPQPPDKCAEGGGIEVFSMSGLCMVATDLWGIGLLIIPSVHATNGAPGVSASIKEAVQLLLLKP